MKAKPRSILILGTTLLVGMLLGALLQTQFFDKRVKRAHRMSTTEGFVESYVSTIQPTSPEQEAAVREVLGGFSEEVHEDFRLHREALNAKLEAMREALTPLLSEDQVGRLKARSERRRPE